MKLIRHSNGVRLAHSHQGVNRGIELENTYEMIQKAILEPSADHLSQTSGLAAAFQRLDYLGERFHENYRLSRAAKINIQKEVAFLKNRLHKILTVHGSQANPPGAIVSDEDVFISRSPDQTKYRVSRLADAIFSDSYRPRSESLEKLVTAMYQKRHEQEYDVPHLSFEGPKGLFDNKSPIIRTVNDIRDDINTVITPDNDLDIDVEPEEWAQNVADMTTRKIADNPLRSLASQIGAIRHDSVIQVLS